QNRKTDIDLCHDWIAGHLSRLLKNAWIKDYPAAAPRQIPVRASKTSNVRAFLNCIAFFTLF
ncbi:MAG: hypothetical protein ACKPJD_12540, partial [Planctomycetaceae bacterium]